MKRILILLVAFLTAQLSQATDGEKEVASTIQTVKVFRQGAQVQRTGKTSIPAGQTILKFTNLSPDLDPQSIQFKADGDFTILSVNHQLNYLKETEQSGEYKKLVGERDSLQNRIEREQAILQVLNEEEKIILNNNDVKGQTEGVSPEKLKILADFYRTRLSEIKLKKLDINQNIKKWQIDIVNIQTQLNKTNTNAIKTNSEVLVKVAAKMTIAGNFEFSYFLKSAGWYPAYDARVKDINSPVSLFYKANVFQNSKEDWKNVQLVLSTGNPNYTATKPVLQVWRLYLNSIRFVPPVVKKDEEVQEEMTLDEVVVTGYGTSRGRDKLQEAEIPQVQVVENTTTVEFRIELPYDIPADGKQYTVGIKEFNIPAYYEYYAAPKLDPTAYLTAQLTNWEQYNLLNGEANLYFEGTFFGKSFLDVQSTEDTLTLSLGRDESVVVTRTKEKQFGENQFIGNKKTETRGWDIELRNKKKQKINIVVEDQYPLSTNDDIEVTLENAKGAEVDKENAKLKWKLAIEPNKVEKLNFRYAVKYPKKERLVLE